MLNKVPKDFTFFVKAHRELIHVRKKAQETLPRFHEMLKAYHRKYPYFDGPHGNSSSSVGCGDCTELLQACSRNEIVLRTYHLRKPENPIDVRSLNDYRYQLSHFSIPVAGRDLRLTSREWMTAKASLPES